MPYAGHAKLNSILYDVLTQSGPDTLSETTHTAAPFMRAVTGSLNRRSPYHPNGGPFVESVLHILIPIRMGFCRGLSDLACDQKIITGPKSRIHIYPRR